MPNETTKQSSIEVSAQQFAYAAVGYKKAYGHKLTDQLLAQMTYEDFQDCEQLGMALEKRSKAIRSRAKATIITCLIGFGAIAWGASSHTVSHLEDIPCVKQTEQSSSMTVGQTSTRQQCVKGTREVSETVRNWDGEELDNNSELMSAGQPEITVVGTAAPVTTYAATSGSYRTGAICSDGWVSSATGSGACSHHGGVGHWTY